MTLPRKGKERFPSPDFQSRPSIVKYEIVFLVQCGREGDVGLELSLSPLLTPLPGKVIGHCVDGNLGGGRIICVLTVQFSEYVIYGLRPVHPPSHHHSHHYHHPNFAF